MQLYILDKDPQISAQMVPDKYKFKMLIELGQLLAGAGITEAYKPIRQGKELQQWIKNNSLYTYIYFSTLLNWAEENINMKNTTKYVLSGICNDLSQWTFDNNFRRFVTPTHAYLRYAKEYECDVPSKTLLDIDTCIEQYKKYLLDFKKVELGEVK